MRTLGLLAVLCTTLSYSAIEIAEAAPDGTRARPALDGRAGVRGDRLEKLERIEPRVLEQVRQADEKRYETLMDLKNKRPRAYRHLMMRSGKAMRFADKNPGIVQRFYRAIDLTAEMGELADGFDTLSTAQQTRRRGQMADVAREMFELKQEGQRERLAAMEARLEQVRKKIADKDAAKEQIVDDMVGRILTPKRDRKRKQPR